MNNVVNGDVILGSMNWRYAVKKFDSSKKLSSAQWSTLEQALILSPSSYGLQPWKFLVVTDPKIRKELTPAAYGQTQIEDCSHLVVIAAKNSMTTGDVEQYVSEIAKVRGVSTDSLSEYRDMMVGTVTSQSPEAIKNWTAKQCYIALGTLLTTAAMIGVDASPMEGFVPAKFNEILQIGKLGDYSAVVVATLGFRASSDGYASAKKVRFPASQVVVKY